MNGSGNLTWLVWKEYRQNRLIVFVTLFLLAVPYLIGLYVLWRWGIRVRNDERPWKVYLTGVSMYSIGLSQLAMALIGGNVIAGERVDRSAEFQGYLPIRRRKNFVGKMLLAILLAAAVWLPNTLVLWRASDWLGPSDQATFREIFANIAIVGLTFFCVAWFFSASIRSPTIAVCAGLATPLLVVGSIIFIAYLREISETPLVEFWFPAICLTLSPICFALGTWLYLRRVEP
jgi:ABC-type transport system involved in multi-copper enzyme maturation permease subunit